MPSAATTPAASRVAPGVIEVDRSGDSLTIRTAGYRLAIPDLRMALLRAPIAVLEDGDGRFWSHLSLLASAHTRLARDETVRIERIDVQDRPDMVEVRVIGQSSVWRRRDLLLSCGPDGIEVRLELEGEGSLTGMTVFGGRGAMPNSASGEFRSDIRFAGVLVPAATEPIALVRPSAVPAVLGVVGDADAGRLNAVFSPPPLAFGFSREAPTSATEPPGGDWLALWLRAPVEQLTMTAVRYAPIDGGFLLECDYEGHTDVDGSWTSPTIVLRPVGSAWSVLEQYRADLVAHDFAPATSIEPKPVWWSEPIFCGWGAQCARAAHQRHGVADPDADAPPDASVVEEVTTVRSAPSFAREDVYDQFMARLAANAIRPGTIVIDDRWQSTYGTGEVDLDHWPDLRRWIDERHAEGRKVLLWWKAWDAEGIPVEECVRNAAGGAVTVDAGNPAYLERLAGVIHHLLSAEGLDADGLKIDFTQRGPSGESLVGTQGVWGIAALHRLLSTIAEAARAARPDPLLIAHAMHPSFADVCDMVRLNDVSKRDVLRRRVPVVDQLRMRHAIASRVLPDRLIDTDQWPMPNRGEWLSYLAAQAEYGVPALYYLESMDRSGEHITPEDLALVAETWQAYRSTLP
jgi:hypothetical protein